MDIQVASNLERYLYLLLHCDSDCVVRFMNQFLAIGFAEVKGGHPVDPTISSHRVDVAESLRTIQETWTSWQYVVDPHTAVGLAAAKSIGSVSPIVCLATAHPAKFPDAVARATGEDPPNHPTLDGLDRTAARKVVLPANERDVRAYLTKMLDGS
jgi:threonine synthase